ncbi:hypothetical protein J7T55_013044 [Diaporthe amygdali]|uniref:uncharacterized protein n=1 Tax=Phomopsis amygdali TaxID=1214568 RepID=UPI0022FE8C07|nr:uncharacterized protein J7T55_013044 [Diaporthe amygdali]KAJ0118789.1 hypothetical protein J7T55_013044 [Diaporthe amygdali]
MIGSRACLAFTLLCLVYFVAHFEKYSLLPSVKVNWAEGTRLPAITWGDESRANDFPNDKPPGSFNKQPFHSDSAIGPDTDGSHLDLSELEGNDSDQNWDGKEDADDADDADDEMYTSVSLSLHGWLMKRGLMPGKSIPIVTIADSSYLHVLHAMQQRLGKWGYDRDLVVLCLDQACAEDTELLNPYPGYLLENDAAMHAVAFFKFMTNLNLSENGYDFVFLDADVFFTGSRDPFSAMLPLSDTSWDLQFQPDNAPDELNIGWYFARSSPATQMFFRQSFAHWIQTRTEKWDQLVMNNVKDDILQKQAAQAAETAGGSNQTSKPSTPPLRIHMLELKYFRNFMKELLWSTELFGNQTATDDYISTAAAIHYTCVQHDLKEYFGLYYNGFGDLHGYYSDPPPLLRLVGISGTSDIVYKQVAFALALGKATNRTVVWPDSVAVFQRWPDGTHHLLARMPSVKAVSFPSAKSAGYAVVEGQYLHNRVRNGLDSLTEVHWSLRQYVEEATIETQSGWLDSLVGSLSTDDGFPVVTLDFNDVGVEWSRLMDLSVASSPEFDVLVREAEAKFYAAFKESGMEAFSISPLAELGRCRWVDGGDGCLLNC